MSGYGCSCGKSFGGCFVIQAVAIGRLGNDSRFQNCWRSTSDMFEGVWQISGFLFLWGLEKSLYKSMQRWEKGAWMFVLLFASGRQDSDCKKGAFISFPRAMVDQKQIRSSLRGAEYEGRYHSGLHISLL